MGTTTRSTRSRLDRSVEALDRQRRRMEQSPLARRVALRRLGLLALAALVGWTVTDQIADAQAARAAWGHTVAVVVATNALEPGEMVAVGTATVQQVPARFVPAAALTSLPTDRRVNASVAAGEMILSSRLAANGSSETSAQLPAGTEGVTVPLGEAPAPVRAGDVVDVFATVPADVYVAERSEAPNTSSAQVVARDASVLAVSSNGATLGVRRDQVAATIAAAAAGQVHLVITG